MVREKYETGREGMGRLDERKIIIVEVEGGSLGFKVRGTFFREY